MSPNRPRPRPTRRYPRLTLRVDVVLELPEERIRAVATTLGAGGLFVAGDWLLPDDERLVARFQLPGDARTLSLEARVVWSARAEDGTGCEGVGLEFVDADARAQFALVLEHWAEEQSATASGAAS